MTQLDLLSYSGRSRRPRLRTSFTARCDRHERSIEERFDAFHKDNPQVFAELRRLALAELAAGATRIGVKALWEQLRRTLEVAHPGEYKLNNSFTAPYARLLIASEPRLDGVIELRRRKHER